MITESLKFTPPSTSNILVRQRLLDLLERPEAKKLVLIVGQPAQGKSTLAASYVKRSRLLTCWINLTEEDSAPFGLYQTVFHGVKSLTGENTSAMVPEHRMEIGPTESLSLFREWVALFQRHISQPIQLVFDALDQLDCNSPSFPLLKAFIQYSGPELRFILLSRAVPPLGILNHRMKQEAVLIDNRDLAFTLDETEEYLCNLKQLSLSKKEIRNIHEITDGWVGAIVMISLILEKLRKTTSGEHFLKELQERFKYEIFHYYEEEIFSKLSKEIREFLLETCHLDMFGHDIISHIDGLNDSAEILKELTEKNFFIKSYYDRDKGTLYQYHSLFKDFLIQRFHSEKNEGEKKSLYRKIACAYEKNGELEKAVEFFLRAESYEEAVSAIERVGMEVFRKGKLELLSKWIKQVPQEIVENNPWLLLYETLPKWALGGIRNLSTLRSALDKFKKAEDVKGRIMAIAFLIKDLLYLGTDKPKLCSLLEDGERLLIEVKGDWLPYEKGLLQINVGLCHILGTGDLRKGISASQGGYLVARQIRDHWLEIKALTYSILGLSSVGEFSKAEEIAKKTERLIQKSIFPEVEVIYIAAMADFGLKKGDMDLVKEALHKLEALIQQYGLVLFYPIFLDLWGVLKVYLGEFTEAEKIGENMLSLARFIGNSYYEAFAYRLVGLALYYKGSFVKAKEITDLALEDLKEQQRLNVYYFRTKELMGLVCYHLGDFQRAETELKEAAAYFEGNLAYQSMAEVYIALALLCWKTGDREGTIRYLERGLSIGRERNYEHWIILRPQDGLRACFLALELGVDGVSDYVMHLVSSRYANISRSELEKLPRSPSPNLRKKGKEIQRRIYRSTLPKIRIQTFGKFQVFRGETPLNEKVWSGNQPKQLLKAILAHGSRRVPKDLLMEELWPGEKPSKVENKFKVTLHRLRRALEPKERREFGSSYIHLKDNLIELDEQLCQIDANLFNSLYNKGMEKEKGGDIKGAMQFFIEAEAIYKGDFLPDDLYSSGVSARREEFRQKFVDLLYKMAELNEKTGAMRKAIGLYKRVVKTDPLLEQAYQRLMVLYAERGMRNEALRVFQECKDVLASELHLDPSATTVAIYKRILEQA